MAFPVSRLIFSLSCISPFQVQFSQFNASGSYNYNEILKHEIQTADVWTVDHVDPHNYS